METSSESLDGSSKGEIAMTDAHYAADLIHETYPIRAGRNVKAAIGDAFLALKRRERQLPVDVLRERPRQWTERRVKALWNREARRVDHYEIQDLTAVAVEEARHERARLRAREQRLEAFLTSQASSGDSPSDQRVGRLAGGLDSTGICGAETDEDFDQTSGWGL